MAVHIGFEDGTATIAADVRLDDWHLEYVDTGGDLSRVSLHDVRVIRQADEDET